MVVEVTAHPEKFGGASLGAVMERIELNFWSKEVKIMTITHHLLAA